MKVLIIIPYFNSDIKWIEYFLISCKYNSDINWLLYGNFDETSQVPDNVHIKRATLYDLNNMVSKNLGVNVNIINPYKICDLRPAFGQIFQEFISGYNFWGYSDIDLVYGKFTDFIDFKELEMYDILTSRDDYFPGHFMLYKNNPKMNGLYKQIFRYKQIFQDSLRHYATDERSNLIGKLLNGQEPWTIRRSIKYRLLKWLPVKNDMNRVLQSQIKYDNLKALRLSDVVRSDLFFSKMNYQNWEIIWNNGHLTDLKMNKLLLYFHFLISKNDKSFIVFPCNEVQEFHISKEGISPQNNSGKDRDNL